MDSHAEKLIRSIATRPYSKFSCGTVHILLDEIDQLRDTISSMGERIALQSELLSKRAERVDPVEDIGRYYREIGGDGVSKSEKPTKPKHRIPYETWINSHLSIVRHYGCCTLNGKTYRLDFENCRTEGEGDDKKYFPDLVEE